MPLQVYNGAVTVELPEGEAGVVIRGDSYVKCESRVCRVSEREERQCARAWVHARTRGKTCSPRAVFRSRSEKLREEWRRCLILGCQNLDVRSHSGGTDTYTRARTRAHTHMNINHLIKLSPVCSFMVLSSCNINKVLSGDCPYEAKSLSFFSCVHKLVFWGRVEGLMGNIY